MDPAKADEALQQVVARIRGEVDRAKGLEDERFEVYVSTNLRSLEDGTWRDLARQPRTCHMQALRQVLTPMGLYNCPAHRGVDKARIGDKHVYARGEGSAAAGEGLATILDGFDASHECREVTCLYHDVNWWIEDLIEDPTSIEAAPETGDYFL